MQYVACKMLFNTRSLGALRAQLLARGPSALLTCPSHPSGAQAKGHTHCTLTIYDALAIDDAAEILLRTDGQTDGRTDGRTRRF